MSRRRLGAIPAVLGTALVAGVAAVAAFGFGGTRAEPTATRPTNPAATAKVVQRTLTETKSLVGELNYGAPLPLESKAAGTVTWLPGVRTTVRRGGVLLRADEQPVLLMYGQLPAFRELRKDLEGRDVLQFERNLYALGYRGFTVDEEFSSYTEAAVKRWQRDLELAETGKVEVGRIVYASGPLRIAEQKVRIGAPATGEVLSSTNTTKVVTVEAQTIDLGWAVKGAAVTVQLPEGKQLEGTVSNVGVEATSDQSEGAASDQPATVPVTISVQDQRVLGRFDKAPVDVTFVVQERKDVFAVPVAALLALSEGGYGLEVVDGKQTKLVAVRTGLFSDGLVEVSGAGVRAGLAVGMPK